MMLFDKTQQKSEIPQDKISNRRLGLGGIFANIVILFIGLVGGFVVGINQCLTLPPSLIPQFPDIVSPNKSPGKPTEIPEPEMYTHKNFETYDFWTGFNLYYNKSWEQTAEKDDQPESLKIKFSKENAILHLTQGPVTISTCVFGTETPNGEGPFINMSDDYRKVKKPTGEIWRVATLQGGDKIIYKVCQREPDRGTFLDTTYAGTITLTVPEKDHTTVTEFYEILELIEKLDPGGDPVIK
jgi:hypothetical protein